MFQKIKLDPENLLLLLRGTLKDSVVWDEDEGNPWGQIIIIGKDNQRYAFLCTDPFVRDKDFEEYVEFLRDECGKEQIIVFKTVLDIYNLSQQALWKDVFKTESLVILESLINEYKFY